MWVWSWIVAPYNGKLGGGNSKIFWIFFIPKIWGRLFPIWRAYFSKGLVQPPTRRIVKSSFLTHFEHFWIHALLLKHTQDICRSGDCFLSHSLGWILGWFYRWSYKSPTNEDTTSAWHGMFVPRVIWCVCAKAPVLAQKTSMLKAQGQGGRVVRWHFCTKMKLQNRLKILGVVTK